MSDQKLMINFDAVFEALQKLKKDVDPCEASIQDAQWMAGDQTSAKWGTEAAAGSFSTRYRDFLTRLSKQIDQWQSDLTTFMKRVNQAQEQLDGASAAEAAVINQMLVDEWLQESGPGQSDAQPPQYTQLP